MCIPIYTQTFVKTVPQSSPRPSSLRHCRLGQLLLRQPKHLLAQISHPMRCCPVLHLVALGVLEDLSPRPVCALGSTAIAPASHLLRAAVPGPVDVERGALEGVHNLSEARIGLLHANVAAGDVLREPRKDLGTRDNVRQQCVRSPGLPACRSLCTWGAILPATRRTHPPALAKHKPQYELSRNVRTFSASKCHWKN